MVTSMQALGHEVPLDDPSAPVQISLCNPYQYKFHPGQYKIGYTPWESTYVPDGWLDRMNQCDEIWATSEWVRDVYIANDVRPPVFVYEHGIDRQWQPIRRRRGKVVKFLHIGEPAFRKGGQLTYDAFREAFGDRSDVHLTMKAYFQHHLRTYTDDGFTSQVERDNISVITDEIPKSKLMELYATHDIMVYPTYGEGFGFIPLQALATGMPVISTGEWAPYRKYLKRLEVPGRWDRSIWSIHPGDVFYPDFNSLVRQMKFAASVTDTYHDLYYEQAPAVIEEFDWLKKTESAFAHIVERFTDN